LLLLFDHYCPRTNDAALVNSYCTTIAVFDYGRPQWPYPARSPAPAGKRLALGQGLHQCFFLGRIPCPARQAGRRPTSATPASVYSCRSIGGICSSAVT